MNAPHPFRTAHGHLPTVAPGRTDELAIAARDFLNALDRGRLPVAAKDFIIGPAEDRAETASLAALREAVAAHDADYAMIAAAHRCGQAIAADLYGEARP